MRYQGRIDDWKDARGFGFIQPNGGGAKVFLHVSAMRRGEPRPAGNELVTYELGAADQKGPRAQDVAFVERGRSEIGRRRDASSKGAGIAPWIAIGMLAAMAWYGWHGYSSWQERRLRSSAPPREISAPAAVPRAPSLADQLLQPAASSTFKCEGKQYCSQMTSCEEAKFYLRNCPGVKIDGDGDGIPCESQWCK